MSKHLLILWKVRCCVAILNIWYKPVCKWQTLPLWRSSFISHSQTMTSLKDAFLFIHISMRVSFTKRIRSDALSSERYDLASILKIDCFIRCWSAKAFERSREMRNATGIHCIRASIAEYRIVKYSLCVRLVLICHTLIVIENSCAL